MAIKTGIGVGEAQVFDTSGIMNTYFKLIQNQQKERAKYQAELADIISKVDTEGINDADKEEIAKMYDSVKELYRSASSAKGTQNKALLRSQITKAVSDLNQYAQNSADFKKRYASMAKDIAQNEWAYDQSKVQEFKSLINQPLTKLGAKASLDPFDYQKLPDTKSRDLAFTKINRQGENFADYKIVNIGSGREQSVGVLPDNKLNEFIVMNLEANPEYRSLAFRNWSEANPGQPIDAKKVVANEIALYKAQFGNQYKSAPTRIKVDKPDKPTSADKYASLLRSAFAGDEQALYDIRDLAGGNIVKIQRKDGKIVITPNKVIRTQAGLEIPYEGGTITASNYGELVRFLDKLSVNKGNIDVLSGLRGTPRVANPPKPSQPTPTPKKESLAEQMKRARAGK